MLQPKGLWGRAVGEKVMASDGKILEELEGLPGPSKLPSRLWASWVNGRT